MGRKKIVPDGQLGIQIEYKGRHSNTIIDLLNVKGLITHTYLPSERPQAVSVPPSDIVLPVEHGQLLAVDCTPGLQTEIKSKIDHSAGVVAPLFKSRDFAKVIGIYSSLINGIRRDAASCLGIQRAVNDGIIKTHELNEIGDQALMLRLTLDEISKVVGELQRAPASVEKVSR